MAICFNCGKKVSEAAFDEDLNDYVCNGAECQKQAVVLTEKPAADDSLDEFSLDDLSGDDND